MRAANSVKTPLNGVHYFTLGWKLIFTPKLKHYVFLPILVNILLMGSGLWWLFSNLTDWIDAIMAYIPHWLQWLSYLIWPLAVLSLLLFCGYFFTTLANWIAAPFNGLLAEQVEALLTGKPAPDVSMLALLKDVPRILLRELQKLLYYLPRIVLLLIISLIPGLGQTIGPILLFLFGAWMMAIQYGDYFYDNHRIPFVTMRQTMHRTRYSQLQFGALISLFLMIPLVNMVMMPIAVCGATAFAVAQTSEKD